MRCFQLILSFVLLSQSLVAAELNESPYFKKDYQEAKQVFQDYANEIKKRYPKTQIGSEAIVAGGETLSVDYVYIPIEKSNSLLIVNSGTHGIESHVGSAVQLYFLDQFAMQEELTETSVLIIHGLNAFGFKHNRRANENNVDLNRNFVTDLKIFDSKNDGYEKVQEFLNPESKLHIGLLSRLGFVFESLVLIMQYSMENLRKAVLMGQYQMPQGIFFGGTHYQPQFYIFQNIIKNFEAKHRFLIDLHSGYGTRGQLHLLSNDENAEEAPTLKAIFAPTEIDWASKKNFYKTSGDITNYFVKGLTKGKANIQQAITFEYGTLDSQTTLGSIESLRRIIYENQSYHHSTETPADSQKIQTLYQEMFYPSDPEWRQKILDQSKDQFRKILTHLSKVE